MLHKMNKGIYSLLERNLSMSSLMDAVLRTSRVSGMTLSDLLSDLADVLGDEVLGREDGLVAGFHSHETPSDTEERLRWMAALDSFLEDQAISE